MPERSDDDHMPGFFQAPTVFVLSPAHLLLVVVVFDRGEPVRDEVIEADVGV